jgi:ABC-type sugar transport system ATPase subunit
MSEYILEARGMVKTFPGVRALNCVNLSVRKGEVHALVGENGAGKSTLMLTLGGVYKPDEGEIRIEGEKVSFYTAHDANHKGISIVYQELSLVPNLSVAENIFANRQPVRAWNIIDRKELNRRTKEMLAMFDMNSIDPETLVKELSIANQQVVEILKAMSFHPKVLILDEPTSSLTEVEVKQLFKNIRTLKSKGISFIYISHHLHEIFEIADTVTVLRDGEHICEANVREIDEDFLVTSMVGRKIDNIYGKRDKDTVIGNVLFEAKNLSRAGVFRNVSFAVRSGEIVGFAGLVGAGRTEVGRAIFGAEPADSGQMLLDGKELKNRIPMDGIQNRIGYMSEDRKTQGLYLNFSIKNNLIANHLKDFCRYGFISEKLADHNGHACVEKFCVVTPDTDQTVGNLSGGNQQKVLLSAWFGINPRLLIVDEPTRGVDVGAKSEIYMLLRELAKTGVGIIMISSDLSEILGVSDRILVMREGGIVGELSRDEAKEENVIALAAGVQSSEKGA